MNIWDVELLHLSLIFFVDYIRDKRERKLIRREFRKTECCLDVCVRASFVELESRNLDLVARGLSRQAQNVDENASSLIVNE